MYTVGMDVHGGDRCTIHGAWGWMYTVGMGRSLAVGGGGWQLSVGVCIYFNNLQQAARHFFFTAQ